MGRTLKWIVIAVGAVVTGDAFAHPCELLTADCLDHPNTPGGQRTHMDHAQRLLITGPNVWYRRVRKNEASCSFKNGQFAVFHPSQQCLGPNNDTAITTGWQPITSLTSVSPVPTALSPQELIVGLTEAPLSPNSRTWVTGGYINTPLGQSQHWRNPEDPGQEACFGGGDLLPCYASNMGPSWWQVRLGTDSMADCSGSIELCGDVVAACDADPQDDCTANLISFPYAILAQGSFATAIGNYPQVCAGFRPPDSPCGEPPPGGSLDNAQFITLSPDGNYLYASSYGVDGKGGISSYRRDPTNGGLTHIQSIAGLCGSAACDAIKPIGLAIPPDGQHLYAVDGAAHPGNVVAYTRILSGADAGKLQCKGRFSSNGLTRPTYIASSNSHVVVSSGSDTNQLTLFTRNLTTGDLVFVSHAGASAGGCPGSQYCGMSVVAISPDATTAYAAATHAQAILECKIAVPPFGCLKVAVFGSPQTVALSEDGLNVYFTPDAVTRVLPTSLKYHDSNRASVAAGLLWLFGLKCLGASCELIQSDARLGAYTSKTISSGDYFPLVLSQDNRHLYVLDRKDGSPSGEIIWFDAAETDWSVKPKLDSIGTEGGAGIVDCNWGP